jgi:hypothetical protein
MPSAKRSSAGKPPHARINFDDRIGAAEAAKKAVLERFLARPKGDDPAFQEKQAELKAVADARAARAAERKAAKEAEAAQAAAERTIRLKPKRRKQRWSGSARLRATPATPLVRHGKSKQSLVGSP